MYSTDRFISTNPAECSFHAEYLIAGKCHKCEVRWISDALITFHVRFGNMANAIRLLRLNGF